MKSLTEFYKIGAGPSSSHTMGPEKACKIFAENYKDADSFKVILYGSLAMTGKGTAPTVSLFPRSKNRRKSFLIPKKRISRTKTRWILSHYRTETSLTDGAF
ncbi:MAG: hypothetical protein L6V85_08775 [Clostridiales bacterium]|nr:MAG: hypothetical protein L6V85_08775 [Clostridiales bacterium]